MVSYTDIAAIGGELNTESVFKAYQQGIFPWYEQPPVVWWSPVKRSVITAESLHISRSMRPLVNQFKLKPQTYSNLQITTNQAFRNVITLCRDVHSGDDNCNGDGWLCSDMIDTYCQLHSSGNAHSFELWMDDRLIAGVYGVHSGTVFSAESMFGLINNASKLLLLHCCLHLFSTGIKVVDSQVINSHTQSLGAIEISRQEFLNILRQPPIIFHPLTLNSV